MLLECMGAGSIPVILIDPFVMPFSSFIDWSRLSGVLCVAWFNGVVRCGLMVWWGVVLLCGGVGFNGVVGCSLARWGVGVMCNGVLRYGFCGVVIFYTVVV